MSVKERLKELIHNYGGTQEKLAEYLGVPVATLRSWIQRDTLPGTAVVTIADKCKGVSKRWLLRGEGDMFEKKMGNYYDELPVSAGQLMWAEHSREDPTDNVYFPGCKADFFFPVHGISMEPMILDGDVIGVKKVDEIGNFSRNNIYLVIGLDGLRAIKHIEKEGDQLRCMSSNPQVKDFYIPLQNIVHVYQVIFSARLYH
ncbi:MAG: S24 family peptidase [Prevotellaceae bacterium]|nr:S24 family peptidase [Prevotellaceae bacterium]